MTFSSTQRMHARHLLRHRALHAALIATLAITAFNPAAANPPDFDALLKKTNLYIEAVKYTERAVDSWDRYRNWVNLKTGPTGREEYIDYGLYSVPELDGQLSETRAIIPAAPPIDKLDAAMTRYIDASTPLIPVLNRAADYYDNKEYAGDKIAEGKELHKKIVVLIPPFLDARAAVMPDLRALARDVEGREIAVIEAREGKSQSYHAAAIQHAAGKVIDFFPRVRPEPMTHEMFEQAFQELGPDTPGEKFDELIIGKTTVPDVSIDVGGMGEALQSYRIAVTVFDSFAATEHEGAKDFESLKPLPKKLLDMLSELHAGLVKSGGKDFDGGGQLTMQIVGLYFELINAVSPIAQSQVRSLP
jgi:hypothetical protein